MAFSPPGARHDRGDLALQVVRHGRPERRPADDDVHAGTGLRQVRGRLARRVPAAQHEDVEAAHGPGVGGVPSVEDAGADEIMCLIQMGTVPQDACMETIRQWGEHVIPHFRKKRAAVA